VKCRYPEQRAGSGWEKKKGKEGKKWKRQQLKFGGGDIIRKKTKTHRRGRKKKGKNKRENQRRYGNITLVKKLFS